MSRYSLPITLCLFVGISSGCANPWRLSFRNNDSIQLVGHEQADGRTLYVVGHGWHTGLVVKTSDVSPDIWPEVLGFSDSEFVEIGWGDEGFYRANKITVPLVLKAAFLPTPSVLHVAGFRGTVKQVYQTSDIVEMHVSHEEFDEMCQFVGNTFEHDESMAPIQLGPGIYGDSAFYRAKGKYYVPKTCNIWTARALKAAGLPMFPSVAMTAESVLRQARQHGKDLQHSPRGIKKAALQGTDGE